MSNFKIGILGASEIAFRRFLPALDISAQFEFVGIASRTPEKAAPFTERFGGKIYPSYDKILEDKNIDAVYIPLPPALHAEWGEKALKAGKHVLLEKPFTTSLFDTEQLIQLANEKELFISENYMFLYHRQLAWIEDKLKSGELGELRLIRSTFGFPRRAAADFRYNKELGVGALLDCGVYPVRLAQHLLGATTRVVASRLNYIDDFDVDIYGCATLENDIGQAAQISFGMDNSYKCELEIWGSKGCLITDRIFSAPSGYKPKVTIKTADVQNEYILEADDSFANSINSFANCIRSVQMRNIKFEEIIRQSKLIERLKEINK